MTREEHIYQLKQYLQGKSISMCPASSLYWQEHWEEVIKALEQEQFINKPCVSEKSCEHDKNVVLDKIRAEILESCGYSKDYEGTFTYSTMKLQAVLSIIDKHKSESEYK